MKRMHVTGCRWVAVLMLILFGLAPLQAWAAPAKPRPGPAGSGGAGGYARDAEYAGEPCLGWDSRSGE